MNTTGNEAVQDDGLRYTFSVEYLTPGTGKLGTGLHTQLKIWDEAEARGASLEDACRILATIEAALFHQAMDTFLQYGIASREEQGELLSLLQERAFGILAGFLQNADSGDPEQFQRRVQQTKAKEHADESPD